MSLQLETPLKQVKTLPASLLDFDTGAAGSANILQQASEIARLQPKR